MTEMENVTANQTFPLISVVLVKGIISGFLSAGKVAKKMPVRLYWLDLEIMRRSIHLDIDSGHLV